MNTISLSFQDRLGKKVIIKKNLKSDKLIRKQRYLNSISNTKKLKAFNKNDNITDLEQIRLLYNESISVFNQNAEEHNTPIRQKKINDRNEKKREITKIKREERIKEKIYQSRLGKVVIIKKKIEEPRIHFQLVLQREKTFKKDWYDHEKKRVTQRKGNVVQEELITKTYFDKKSNVHYIAYTYEEEYSGYVYTITGYKLNIMDTGGKQTDEKEHMMKRSFVLKTDWLQYSSGISQSAYEESDNDYCVYRQLEEILLHPKTGIPKKRINGTKVSHRIVG